MKSLYSVSSSVARAFVSPSCQLLSELLKEIILASGVGGTSGFCEGISSFASEQESRQRTVSIIVERCFFIYVVNVCS